MMRCQQKPLLLSYLLPRLARKVADLQMLLPLLLLYRKSFSGGETRVIAATHYHHLRFFSQKLKAQP